MYVPVVKKFKWMGCKVLSTSKPLSPEILIYSLSTIIKFYDVHALRLTIHNNCGSVIREKTVKAFIRMPIVTSWIIRDWKWCLFLRISCQCPWQLTTIGIFSCLVNISFEICSGLLHQSEMRCGYYDPNTTIIPKGIILCSPALFLISNRRCLLTCYCCGVIFRNHR